MISSNILDVFKPKKDDYILPESHDDCISCLTISGLVMGFFGVTLSFDKTLAINKKVGSLKVVNMIPHDFGPRMRYGIRGLGVMALIGAFSRGVELYRVVKESKPNRR